MSLPGLNFRRGGSSRLGNGSFNLTKNVSESCVRFARRAQRGSGPKCGVTREAALELRGSAVAPLNGSTRPVKSPQPLR